MRLRNDNVLVALEAPAESQTAGGIIVPAQANAPRQIDTPAARVLEVGPGFWSELDLTPYRHESPAKGTETHRKVPSHFVPTEVQQGERVLLGSPDAGQRLTAGQKGRMGLESDIDFRIVREEEILAVIDDDTVVGFA